MPRVLLLACLLVPLAACDAVNETINNVREGIVQAQGVSEDIEKAVGARAGVSVNWKNGELELVNVSFEGVPKDIRIAELAEHARASIRKRLAKEPKRLVIAFTIKTK